jgi:hypothetical protein
MRKQEAEWVWLVYSEKNHKGHSEKATKDLDGLFIPPVNRGL